MTVAEFSCHTCGTVLRAHAKFCDECGSATASNAAPAEYKQVTVLFADVVHSMDIAAAVGAERLREIMAGLVEQTAAVVRRFGGTVDKFTGDGIMAVFGAPAALEDHAFRASAAAMDIQAEAAALAQEIRLRDGVVLQLRVGLNSGEVIAGEIGSGSLGYTTIGEQVGMAQRMESVAPPGGVILSESTARLVEDLAVLGEPELVRIKGAKDAVSARRLMGIAAQPRRTGLSQSTLVGRQWELTTLTALLDRSAGGSGVVVGVVGPPGIGKTRLTSETAALAKRSGIEVFSTFCESHATDVPFNVVARLLRAVTQIGGLDDQAARMLLRQRFAEADPEDMLFLDDLLSIADPAVAMPKIDPDARRRRLTALINTAQLARTQPALFVVEDVHWIDEVSDSLLADFLVVIAQTPSMMLLTYRPEYQGALKNVGGAQTIALAPLSDDETSNLVDELLGADPTVSAIRAMIAARAAGNPFFAQELTRELAQQRVLIGQRGSYACRTDVGEVRVPATLQATIAARIDRLEPAAKRTLTAAAVIGSRFTPDLLNSLGIDPHVEELIGAELIDQVRFTPHAEYAFRHPLIRSVAYEAQLKSDRTELHRRLAVGIEAREPDSADQNAALIAEHLEAAGDLLAAYGWQMRAASWATTRDITAAQLNWQRAINLADALGADFPDRAALRIAPRTMLCGIGWRVHERVAGADFEQLRELCTAAGDKSSLAVGMAGLIMDLLHQDRMREAAELASQAMALIESIGDPTLTVGLSFAANQAKGEICEWSDVLRWSQRVIELADGDSAKGNLIYGSPLALAFGTRGLARYSAGLPGWRDDLRDSVAIARSADAVTFATVVAYVYFVGIPFGVLTPDASVLRELEEALRIAERSSDDIALTFSGATLGTALVHRQTAAEHERGEALLAHAVDVFIRCQWNLGDVQVEQIYLAREQARRGDRDGAILLMREIADHLFRDRCLLTWGILATGVLVETLLDRGGDADIWEAEAAIERLAAATAEEPLALREIWLLRLRALLARARCDDAVYAGLRDRYRDMAKSLDFDGHIDWAAAMP
jgi:class 3 adenylate cyclase